MSIYHLSLIYLPTHLTIHPHLFIQHSIKIQNISITLYDSLWPLPDIYLTSGCNHYSASVIIKQLCLFFLSLFQKNLVLVFIWMESSGVYCVPSSFSLDIIPVRVICVVTCASSSHCVQYSSHEYSTVYLFSLHFMGLLVISIFLTTFDIASLLHFSHSGGCLVVSHCG